MDPDYFLAYDLEIDFIESPEFLNSEELLSIYQDLKQTKKTFPLLEEAINSNRFPYTIMLIAAKIGMYIPPKKRVGLDSYKFFIANLKYYESVTRLERIPRIEDIFRAKDPVALLSRYRDSDILQKEYKFTRNYSNRAEMIKNFIYDNILPIGRFKLEKTVDELYSTKTKLIKYYGRDSILEFSLGELIELFTRERKNWKSGNPETPKKSEPSEKSKSPLEIKISSQSKKSLNPRTFTGPQEENYKTEKFSRLSLEHLRDQLLERIFIREIPNGNLSREDYTSKIRLGSNLRSPLEELLDRLDTLRLA